jgi:hypothetical protein
MNLQYSVSQFASGSSIIIVPPVKRLGISIWLKMGSHYYTQQEKNLGQESRSEKLHAELYPSQNDIFMGSRLHCNSSFVCVT